jgi:AraC family transcriptional regulator, transcriptional activator of pobA
MISKTHTIPYYEAINDFLQSLATGLQTNNPNFFCFELQPSNTDNVTTYKSPFKKGFYFIGLVTNAGNTKITYDTTSVTNLNSFLVFQAPNLVYSFLRDNKARGYMIYFKQECFSFFKPIFEKEFPFFNILHSNFFKLNADKFIEFETSFKDVVSTYEAEHDGVHRIASIKLLALLYQLKAFTSLFNQWEQSFSGAQQMLTQKFIQLVNNFYLEKRTVEEYAAMLFVTANHLSHTIKAVTSKNALSFINERIIAEAKSLIKHTAMDITEITYQLHFSDPANFGKFFKKHVEVTPLEFRKTN